MGMTEPTNHELGDLFVADKHWQWIDGMHVHGEALDGPAVILAVRDGQIFVYDGEPPGTLGLANPARLRPKLEHGGTLGLIEHVIVPAALEDPAACLCFHPHERNWYVYSPKHDDCATSKDAKPAALLAALVEADDIVRRSSAESAPVQEEDFGDPDERDDYDGDSDRDGFDDDDGRRYVPEPDEVPTDPKLCTRQPPAQALAARGFLESLRQRDAEREAQRLAKLREKGSPT